tara:strand:- start:229 stop:414 length:186 start_codon:yes stop_codon:yes gene_type:complete
MFSNTSLQTSHRTPTPKSRIQPDGNTTKSQGHSKAVKRVTGGKKSKRRKQDTLRINHKKEN